jgi:hypothetical protein
MFKKCTLIAIIILCLGIIGCTETNEPSFKKELGEQIFSEPVFNSEPNFNSKGIYNVVTVSKKPIDYWVKNRTVGLLRLVHVNNNAEIDKIYLDGYGELAVTKNAQNYAFCCTLDRKYFPDESVSITCCNILGDTLIGTCVFGGQYGGRGCCSYGVRTIDNTVDFIAVKK